MRLQPCGLRIREFGGGAEVRLVRVELILTGMRSPIPTHAERIVLDGETAWVWSTELGWSVLQWPYRVDLENVERAGQLWHTVDWSNDSPRQGGFEGGLARNEQGHLDRQAFEPVAERIIRALHRRDSPPPFPIREAAGSGE